MTIDYLDRLQTLQERLLENKIDVAMITAPANVFYYTGFNSDPHERFMALILDNRKQTFTLFVPSLDKEIADQASSVKNIIPVSDDEDPFKKLQEHIGGTVSTFGVETKTVSMFQHQRMNESFPEANYTDIEPIINKQRLKKTREEMVYAQKAVTIIEKVLRDGIKQVKPGMTELEVTAELEYLMKKHGALGPSFSTIALAGEKAALPHGVPGNRKLKHGDFLLIDMGVEIEEGYCSDITRTFIIGEASTKQQEIYDIVLRSNQAGIDAVKAGVPLKTFDIEARKVIDESGYGQYFNNRIGHGLGIEVHEAPSIHENNQQISESGLFFTIEPGIYIPEYGGVRIEDEVYINENGDCEVITSFPKELQIIS
ncbi:M24 family metallopeptidase [Oceanobacillus halotolerans]|uniref:M24 family metallopeptidase n=1 Tax=Oceanobacillus halotolerans TaxID=2663380 RepID=UPI0013DC2945|nr:Xaa-Pro peptidase family protein [Oceanobacillus halotolerans]